MATGTVKWFNNAKGWGFLSADENDQDIFVHYSSISGGGYKKLVAGQAVRFEINQGKRGLHAVDVFTIDETVGDN